MYVSGRAYLCLRVCLFGVCVCVCVCLRVRAGVRGRGGSLRARPRSARYSAHVPVCCCSRAACLYNPQVSFTLGSSAPPPGLSVGLSSNDYLHLCLVVVPRPSFPPSLPSPSVGSTGRPWRSLRNALDLGTPRRALPRLPGPRPGHHGRRPKCSVCARALFLPPLGASWHPCLALLPTLRALTNTCANSYRLYKNILHSRQWIHGQWMF